MKTLMEKETHLENAKNVILAEMKAIERIYQSLNGEFVDAVKQILACKGRIIVTGMGKSGIIGQKIAATMASTGTPSFFMHPAEGLHGDLGMVTSADIVLAISNSGETPEILHILPSVKRIGAQIFCMTSNPQSSLAKNSHIVLELFVEEEACPLGLTPTASTTATLVLGDALAVTLLSARNFQPENFALFHPGGSLGRRLLLTVEDVLKIREVNPKVSIHGTLKDAILIMTSSRMGAASIVDERERLVGIITDGDIRRHFEKSIDVEQTFVKDIMTVNPTTITSNRLAAEALKIMQDKEIADLPIIDSEGKPVGLINFQDLLKAGVL